MAVVTVNNGDCSVSLRDSHGKRKVAPKLNCFGREVAYYCYYYCCSDMKDEQFDI